MSDTGMLFALLAYGAIAAAFAVTLFRIWRVGRLPAVVASALMTAATLVMAYATTRNTDLFNVLGVSVLFLVAWFCANAVRLVTLKMRGELDA